MTLDRRQCIALLACAAGAGAHGVAPAAAPRKLLVVGDSLSAEYGLPRGSGWVALLEQRLAREQLAVTVVNASISGETTAGGRSRIGALLQQHRPSHVVVELGANDALRGLPLAGTEANLRAMLAAIKAAAARALLVGMQMPPNYGAQYARDFAALYQRVARDTGSALVPFMLAGLADDADPLRWFQSDRIHPIAAAHPRILDTLWPVLGPWLRAAR